jgi:hypothetical protein
MRSAGNFSPEWGYLAPAPSFARTARVVLVATAIGATAGAGVVLSLIDRSGEPEQTPTAARAIVTSVRTAAVPSIAPVAPVAPATNAPPATVAKPSSTASVAATAPSEKPNNSTRRSSRAIPQSRAAVPALANSPAPAPTAPSAAASASANASPNASSPDAAPVPANAPAAVSPTADVGAVVTAPVAAAAPAAATAPAAAPAPAVGTASATATALPGEPPNVVEAAPTDAPDSTSIVAPEPAAPPKKAKRHASSRPAPFAGIGTFFRRAFASHGGRSYYPQ